MAALKIQYFYRQRLEIKQIREKAKRRKALNQQKHSVFNGMATFIIRHKYREMRLKVLLNKIMRSFKKKRKRIVLNSVIFLQYHTRKFLKKLAVKREYLRKLEQENQKKKSHAKGPSKYRIVNRRGKVLRVNILEEKRKKEEQRKALEKLAKTNKTLLIPGLSATHNQDEATSEIKSPQTNTQHSDNQLSFQYLHVNRISIILP